MLISQKNNIKYYMLDNQAVNKILVFLVKTIQVLYLFSLRKSPSFFTFIDYKMIVLIVVLAVTDNNLTINNY